MDQDGSGGRTRLCVLYAVHACALGFWGVNLGAVLKEYGLEHIVPYAFACSSIAAFISPLAMGALADHHWPPERVLRMLGMGSTVFLFLMYFAIQQGWGAGWVLVFTQIHALWSVPTFGLSTSLILSRLSNPKEQFGPIRLWATVGWMAAGILVSTVLHADKSVVSGYAACVTWIITIAVTFILPKKSRLELPKARRTIKEVLGLDALPLLTHPDHRVVFITSALLNMALAAFYPFTVLHLQDLGVESATMVMGIGQISEIITMLALSAVLTRLRLKWVFLAGIGFGVARYALFFLNTGSALVLGIFLHGFCYTLFFITAQIYLEQRVATSMRARAQALMTLMTSGFGNLFGYLGIGWWRVFCMQDGHTDWPKFWAGMTLLTVGVFTFFAVAYKGRNRETQETSRLV